VRFISTDFALHLPTLASDASRLSDTCDSALAANAVASFTLTNSKVTANDYLDVWVKSGNAAAGTYQCWSEGNGRAAG